MNGFAQPGTGLVSVAMEFPVEIEKAFVIPTIREAKRRNLLLRGGEKIAHPVFRTNSVMLSGAGVQRSGTPAESKHPYPGVTAAGS